MAVTAYSLPTNPMAAQATVGKDYLLYVAGIVGVATVESWNIIGGQSGGSIDESTKDVDVTNKASGGFTSYLPGLTDWSISLDAIALMPGSDNGVELIKRAKAQKTQIKIKILYPDGSFRVGWASVSTYTTDTPYDKGATLKGKLTGYGPLSAQSITASVGTPLAQVAYFTSNVTAAAINAFNMTAGSTAALPVTTDWTTTAGSVTLLSTYIATLLAGDEYLFYITLSTGGYSLLPVIAAT
jgi:predicted secreted protein